MKSFESLPAWQAGRVLVQRVYALTRKAPFCRDPGLCGQIQRAAVSVPSNIAEGHERGSTPDLIQFLFYAKGSAGEVRSQLYHAEDLGYAPAQEAEELRQFCREIARQLSGWIQSMQTPTFRRGPAYHKEPDRRWENLVANSGFERLPDGRFREKTENGRTESGTSPQNRVSEPESKS
jgi:four helix bundle protein